MLIFRCFFFIYFLELKKFQTAFQIDFFCSGYWWTNYFRSCRFTDRIREYWILKVRMKPNQSANSKISIELITENRMFNLFFFKFRLGRIRLILGRLILRKDKSKYNYAKPIGLASEDKGRNNSRTQKCLYFKSQCSIYSEEWIRWLSPVTSVFSTCAVFLFRVK